MPDSLHSLSDSDLLSQTLDLVARERAITLRLLIHLNEIERRQLHLQHGYSSMFDYCTTGLRYAEPAAILRIRTARCVARFPEVFALLEANKVSMTTIARISRVLTAENKDELLMRVRHCSVREVDVIVAEFEPHMQVRDVVRSVVVRLPTTEGAPPLLATSPCHVDETAVEPPPQGATKSPADCEISTYRGGQGGFHPISGVARRVRFHFSTSEAFAQKLEMVKSLAWHRLPANASLEHVFELVLDAFIERHDPRGRHERRKERAERRARALSNGTARDASPETMIHHEGVAAADLDTSNRQRRSPVTPNRNTRRHIPAEIRDDVFARDGGRCAFIGDDGRRCDSTVGLQLDHVVPAARGGGSTLDNLRLLCAYHNRYEAERLMGASGRRPLPP